METRVTIRKVREAIPTLRVLNGVSTKNIKYLLAMAHNGQQIDDSLKPSNEAQQALVNAYKVDDKVPEDKILEVNEKIESLLDEYVTLDLMKMSLEEILKETDLTADQVRSIMFILVEV